MYIGGGNFIHSPRTGDVLKISSLDSSWYADTYMGAVRVASAAKASALRALTSRPGRATTRSATAPLCTDHVPAFSEARACGHQTTRGTLENQPHGVSPRAPLESMLETMTAPVNAPPIAPARAERFELMPATNVVGNRAARKGKATSPPVRREPGSLPSGGIPRSIANPKAAPRCRNPPRTSRSHASVPHLSAYSRSWVPASEEVTIHRR